MVAGPQTQIAAELVNMDRYRDGSVNPTARNTGRSGLTAPAQATESQLTEMAWPTPADETALMQSGNAPPVRAAAHVPHCINCRAAGYKLGESDRAILAVVSAKLCDAAQCEKKR